MSHLPAPGDTVELADLCGLRVLDGRGTFVLDWDPDPDRRHYENATVVLLRLDGVVYWFQEDAEDRYRSCLGDIRRIDGESQDVPPGAFVAFDPLTVEVRLRNDSGTTSDEVLYGVDERTGLVLFEVGTEEDQLTYPCFVHRWTPEGVTAPWLAGRYDARRGRRGIVATSRFTGTAPDRPRGKSRS